MINRDELLDLIPAYAIGALDEDERIELEALLKQDAEAQSLLQEYESMASILSFAVPQRPAPAHLRGDLQKRLTARRQNSAGDQTESLIEDIVPETEISQSRILPFPTTVISTVAAMLIVLIGFIFVVSSGILNLDNTSELHPNELLYNNIVAEAGFERYAISPELADTANGELVVSADGSQAILQIASLPDTTDEESYQLWLISDEEVVSGGIFHWASGHGPYFIAIDHPVDDLLALGMTIEPFDGSPLGNSPTGERLFAVSVASAQ